VFQEIVKLVVRIAANVVFDIPVRPVNAQRIQICLADRAGITRSVIVNALRKLESAGVIESRSLGMKGTYIRVLNEKLIPQLDRVRRR
ncbi:MAG: hypothetical protein OWU32_12700, partial [Firmicutes bacterium]|nr:hypothetical protein [Bacillota bacterium]